MLEERRGVTSYAGGEEERRDVLCRSRREEACLVLKGKRGGMSCVEGEERMHVLC